VAAGIVGAAALAAGLLFYRRRRHRHHRHGKQQRGPHGSTELMYQPPHALLAREPRAFTPAQIASATGGFAASHVLGQGAFGSVYRGVLPGGDGRTVAVKQLSLPAAALQQQQQQQQQQGGDASSVAGADKFTGEAGFMRELETLGRCAHENVVVLFGFCIERRSTGNSAFSLVLEFMPGGSLLERLRPASRRPPLTPLQRLHIASDVARGLHYLHTEAALIHQDVKSDNVLLATDAATGRTVAKIADFGTARAVTKRAMTSHHSTRVVIGTTPYMPLEYTQFGHVSEKTDTYAFGVVLCELLTCKEPFNHETGEPLGFTMLPVLQNPEALLPPVLDDRGGIWPSGVAPVLARLAGRCLAPVARDRCTVRDVLPAADRLAGRDVTPAHHTTMPRLPTGAVASAPSMTAPPRLPASGAVVAHGSGGAARCAFCGDKLRFRQGAALPCFTCKRQS
jgi:serine/threonine protein kinase